MSFVTASLRVNNVPLRRVFVEHLGVLGINLGWTLTDQNGSFTFDAGPGFSRIDIRVHCRNSVIRIVDDSDVIPGTSRIKVKMNVGNGEVVEVGSFVNHFRILAQAQDVYDTVWRQFRPYNRAARGAFPLGRKPSVRDTFANSPTCEATFPDQFPIADLTFVEPVGVFNNLMPSVHIKPDTRLFGTATSDPSLMPHELGHVFHFAGVRASTRALFETGYLASLAVGPTHHDFNQVTKPLVAFIEAAGIFSERFFFFAKLVAPANLSGADLRRAFFNDELSANRHLPGVLVDPCPRSAILNGNTVVPSLPQPPAATPPVTRASVEGAVYGAIYLHFARRVGLQEAVGLVIDSNATTFGEFQTYVQGRGNNTWTTAIDAVALTWGM